MRKLIAVVLVAAGAPAAAQEIPRYDVPGECRETATSGGTYSESMYAYCFDREQEAYDALKPMWANLPDTVRAECQSGAASDTYSMLKYCVDREMEARAANEQREFQF